MPGPDPAVLAGVQDLLARYARAIDDRRLDDCAALFAEDAVLVVNGQRHDGRPAIRAWMDELAKNPAGRHLTVNVVVEAGGADGAGAVSDVAYLRRGDGGWQVAVAGRYTDEVAVLDGHWRFVRRDIAID